MGSCCDRVVPISVVVVVVVVYMLWQSFLCCCIHVAIIVLFSVDWSTSNLSLTCKLILTSACRNFYYKSFYNNAQQAEMFVGTVKCWSSVRLSARPALPGMHLFSTIKEGIQD